MQRETCTMMLEHVRQSENVSENWAKMAEKYASAGGGEPNVNAFFHRVFGDAPMAVEPRLDYARRLLGQERIAEATPILQNLADHGVAEGAYCLGVAAIRAGNPKLALQYMRQALELNPVHEETRTQIAHLERAGSE